MRNGQIYLILSLTLIIQGCAYIGYEKISPSHEPFGYADINTNTVMTVSSITEPAKAKINGQYVYTKQDVIKALGPPNNETENTLFYSHNKKLWKGYALDLAIFPLPLTIPFIIPTGSSGVVFEFDDGGYLVKEPTELRTKSGFYGFNSDDSGSRISKGEIKGFWFIQ